MSDTLPLPICVGTGPVVARLPGFGLPPATYATTASSVADAAGARVVVPDLYRLSGRWRYAQVVDHLAATFDDLGVDQLTIIGHSFSGGIELCYGVQHPERILDLVFVD